MFQSPYTEYLIHYELLSHNIVIALMALWTDIVRCRSIHGYVFCCGTLCTSHSHFIVIEWL